MAGKRALCVGINNFKNFPTATLRGCVNDAQDMAKLLKEKHGFKDDEIIVLTDAKATKAAIMKHLKAMVGDAKAGKLGYLVFSLSSHGTQVPDTNGDEEDKADEAFCPYDLAAKGNVWDPDRIITDDELHDLFVQLPAGATLEAFFDTCHSGTGVKVLDPVLLLSPFAPKPRYLPPPDQAPFEQERALNTLATKRSAEKLMGKQHVLWAGCRADQTSADAFFNGRANGAFTYNYILAVRASPKAARAEIRNAVRSALKKGKFEQIPQLETDATNRKAKAAS
jgi:hypothetical protein